MHAMVYVLSLPLPAHEHTRARTRTHTNTNKNKLENNSRGELGQLTEVMDTCDPSAWKTKAGGLGDEGLFGLLSKFKASLSYVIRPWEGWGGRDQIQIDKAE